MANFLKILMLVLDLLSRLPKPAREEIRRRIDFKDIIDLLGDLFSGRGGGGGGESPDVPGGGTGGTLQTIMALVMMVLRILAEFDDDEEVRAVTAELKSTVMAMQADE